MPFSSFSKSKTVNRSILPCSPNFLTLYPNFQSFFLTFVLNFPTPIPAHSFKINYSDSATALCTFQNKATHAGFLTFSTVLPPPPSKLVFLMLSRFYVIKDPQKGEAKRSSCEYLPLHVFLSHMSLRST